jgi:predicted phage terminase large subunit-like protein
MRRKTSKKSSAPSTKPSALEQIRQHARKTFERTVLSNPFIPKSLPPCEKSFPHPRQAQFLAYFGREALFGGAAGGGKSASLLAAALQFIEMPGYEALLCRRVRRHLLQSDGLVPKFHEWMRLTGNTKTYRWNGTELKATWPNGASLTFSHCDHEKHLDQFQGGRWHFCGFDELGQWKKEFYTYLFSRQRKPSASPIPIRTRASANPGGPGHEWVKKRFVVPDAPKYFVPASLHDNPGVDPVDYVQSMAELEPIVRAQLLQGDWNAFAGGRFQKEWFTGKNGGRGWWKRRDSNGNEWYCWTGGPEGGVPASLCWCAITCDPASRAEEANDPTAIGVFLVTPGGEILILEVVREWLPVQAIIPRIAELCAVHQPMWVGIEDTGFQITLLNEARMTPGIPTVAALTPAGKSKLVRARPAIIRASTGQIFLPRNTNAHPWVEDFLAELSLFTGDEKLDAHDDIVDCVSYFVQEADKGGLILPSLTTPDQAQAELDAAQSGLAGGIFMR